MAKAYANSTRPEPWRKDQERRSALPLRMLWTVLPPPRRPVSVADLWPLVIFVLVYAGVCFALEVFHLVQFVSPGAFLLMAGAPWFWWMHAAGYSGLRGGRALTALVIRLTLLGLLVGMIAEPRSMQNNERLAVIFAVDVSPSVSRNLQDAALSFVTRAATTGKPERDEAGLVVFGRNAAVELPPSMSFPFEAVNVQINRDGTNIEKGLSLAGAMIRDDVQGRVVLITDGVATEGALGRVLDDLRARSIPVDVLPINYDYEQEVWIERLQLPKLVKAGETYEAIAIVSSLTAGKGKLILQENDVVQFEEEVAFSAGKNRFAIPIPLREPGFYEYTATIEVPAEGDGVAENNRAISYLYLQGEGKALVVTSPAGNPLDWQPMVAALQNAERDVQVISAYELPRDPLGLLAYDCIIFTNVSADMFDVVQLQAVHDAVQNQGSGFLMVGGENSFGPGGYHRTVIEDLLPVTMDINARKVLPKAALAIILHTCEFPEGNTWAKQITKQAIKVLSEFDDAGVLAYDWNGGEKWIVPMAPVSQYEQMAIQINNAQVGDMPDFASTMRMGLTGLKKNDASTKHMIIISDGDPSPPPSQLLQEFIDAQISITTVAVFPHEIPQNSAPGLIMPSGHPMVLMARATGGRHYLLYAAGDEKKLPAIFIKEAKTLRRSMLQNKLFVPDIGFPSQILKGIDAMPQLGGYVITTMKGTPAANVLTVPDTEDHDPVLARWNYGIGKTAAFTSDLSPRWGADWLRWEQYEAFVKQLVTDISRVQQVSNLRIESFAAGSEGIVIVEDHAQEARFLEMAAVIDGPGNRQEIVALEQVGPRRYEGRFPTWGIGRYQVMATTQNNSASPAADGPVDPDGTGATFTERAHSGFAMPYSQEFMRFRADPITIEQIVEGAAGRLLTPDMTGEQIYDVDRTVRRSTNPLTDQWWLWLVLALLVLHDVGVRRVQMDWALLVSWFGTRARGGADETFDALLRRKQTVTTQITKRQDAGMRPAPDDSPGGIDLTSAPPLKAAARESRTAAPQTGEPDTSTTERLLALKRKRGQDD